VLLTPSPEQEEPSQTTIMAPADTAKKIVSLLQQLPADKVKHYASFKYSQVERFCNIGGIPVPKIVKEEQAAEANKKQVLLKIDPAKLRQMVFAETEKAPDYQRQLFNEDILTQQYKSLKNIHSNKWGDLYAVSNKLLEPKGNPNYYQRLLGDVNNGGQKKEGILTAFKTILTGRY
jgi:cytochrome b pre-mRNA-processing protein 6